MGKRRVRKIRARAANRRKKADWYDLGAKGPVGPGILETAYDFMVSVPGLEESQDSIFLSLGRSEFESFSF